MQSVDSAKDDSGASDAAMMVANEVEDVWVTQAISAAHEHCAQLLPSPPLSRQPEKVAAALLVALTHCGPSMAPCLRCVMRFLNVHRRVAFGGFSDLSLAGVWLVWCGGDAGALAPTLIAAVKQAVEADRLCPLCLGSFAAVFAKDSPASPQRLRSTVAAAYDAPAADLYTVSIFAPPVCTLRDQWYYWKVESALRPFDLCKSFDDVKKLKTALRDSVVEHLSSVAPAPSDPQVLLRFHQHAPLMLSFLVLHDETIEEPKVLYDIRDINLQDRRMDHVRAQRRQRKKAKRFVTNGPMSQAALTQVLATVSPDTLFEHYAQPPAFQQSATLSLEMVREPIHIGGLYNKYSRQLSQSPWNIVGTNVVSSVEEIIVAPIQALFEQRCGVVPQHAFGSAGREDRDVRMLGEGRPFYLQLRDPRFIPSDDDCASIAKAICKSWDSAVTVHNLKVLSSTQVDAIKTSAGEKRKCYQCAVRVSVDVTPELIAKLNDFGSVAHVLQQKTPLRVLHRRVLAVRPRSVYRLSARAASNRVLVLDLETEAGTYVKEFVHGDFGRTEPSIASLLGCEADLLTLDVTNVVCHIVGVLEKPTE